MPIDLKELIIELSELRAPSGHEELAREAVRAHWAPFVDAFETDNLGSLIAIKYGSGPEPRRRIMIAAHMDEIGMIVSEVRDGFILTAPLGGIDYRAMLMQPVTVHGRQPLPGVFGAAPPHMARSRSEYPSAADLWIDVGLPAEEVGQWVQIGDIITFDAPAVALKGHRVAGKSIDNRASVAAVTLTLEALSTRQHDWDVYAVATAQEESGSYGAMAAAFQIEPDAAITIDTTFGTQPGTSDDDTFKLGDGPTLGLGPNFHPRLLEIAREVAGKLEIPYQIEILPGHSGTDAWAIQVSRAGVASLLFSIPIRNMHSPSEVVDLRDIERAGRLMAEVIAAMTPDTLDTIAWPMPDSDQPDPLRHPTQDEDDE